MTKTLNLNIVLADDVDDPTNYLLRVLNDLRSQGRWQMDILASDAGAPLRDPTNFKRIGTVTVREAE